MKYLSLRPIVALSTFIISISVVAFWCFLSRSKQIVIAPKFTPQIQKDNNINTNAWQTLLSFENQDLKALEEQKKKILQNVIDEYVGKRGDLTFPRLLSKISNARHEKFYILIEELPLLSIPGNCGLRIYLFDLNGKQLKELSFDSGWRISLTDIKVRYSKEIERELIEVGSEPVINGRGVAKQYYALIDRNILLIRLEDSKGQLIRNIYGASNYTIGVNRTGLSAEERKSSLKSNDAAETLASLMWLSGEHLNPNKLQNRLANYDENLAEAKLVTEIRSLSEVKATLQKLKSSNNRWLRNAANLVAKIQYYD